MQSGEGRLLLMNIQVYWIKALVCSLCLTRHRLTRPTKHRWKPYKAWAKLLTLSMSRRKS